MRSFGSDDMFHPQAFLNDPGAIIAQSIAVQLAIANHPESPRELLAILVSSDDSSIAEAARLHVNWAGELTQNWQSEIDTVLQTAQLGQNDRLAVELLKIAPVPPAFFSQWVPADALVQGLRNPHMPIRYRLQWLARLAQGPTLEPRLQVAESPEPPVAVLELLVGDIELPVRLAAKLNPNCPPALIELVEGQQAVAADWQTEAEQLALLSQSRWAWLRRSVAQNPSTPVTTLAQLASDAEIKIQLAVAKNPSTSESILAQLASHPETAIQVAVAQHPNATERILLQLLPSQRSLIFQRQNLPAGVLQEFFNEAALAQDPTKALRDLYYIFFRQPNTPETVLDALSEWDVDAIRAYLQAKNQRSPGSEIMEQWVINHMDYLAEVAHHPNVSREILERLAPCPNPKVRLAVAKSPITPSELRCQLLEEMSTRPEQSIQAQVASDINTPVPILEAMAEREVYQPKLLREIRRTITSEYPPNSSSYASLADQSMSRIKHQILTPVGLTVDVERWMEVVESPDVLAAMAVSSRSTDMESSSWYDRLAFRFADLLPELDEEALQRLSREFCWILGSANYEIKNGEFSRSVAIALVGNPNTPARRREELKNQLLRPSKSLDDYDNDCSLLLSIACNDQVSEAERRACFDQLMDVHKGKFLLAANPLTPIELLERLAEQGIQGTWDLVEKIVRNPATPDYLIRQLANDRRDFIWRNIAEYANAPVDVLLKFLYEEPEGKVNSNVSTIDYVLKNRNLPILERYRFLLSQEESQETAKANELLARRLDSPYALAQVIEKGDRNAKITAARSPKTPIAVLAQLARDSDETVRQTVVSNPNLPHSLFITLTDDSSIKVRTTLASIKLPSDILPQVLERLANDEDSGVRTAVGKNPNTPESVLEALAEDSEYLVKSWLTKNPNLPISVLERFELEFGVIVARNPNTPGYILAHAVNRIREAGRFGGGWTDELIDLLKHPVKGTQMPADTLSELASHHNQTVRYRVAQHPNTPVDALVQLANDDYVPTVRAVADNPNTPAHILKQLALNPDLTLRLSVVCHPNTPVSVLADIVLSSQIASNVPNRTVDTLKSAFPGDQYDLLRTIASKPQTPLEALEILARREFIIPPPDPNSILPPRTADDVLKSLAYNPSLPPRLLAILTQDPCVDVRLALIRHPNLTPELWQQLAEDSATSVRSAIAAAHQAPMSVLESIASDPVLEVRQALAANPNVPAEVLNLLAQDEELAVRSSLAANTSTPAKILDRLASDDKVEVRRAVAKNPNTPDALKERLKDLLPHSTTAQISPTLRGLPRLYNPQTDDLTAVLTEYAQSENVFVRFVTLLHPLTAPEMLQQGATSLLWLERYAVAENAATPAAIRQLLTQDCNCLVRAVATAYRSA
jgi:hypothetical protein